MTKAALFVDILDKIQKLSISFLGIRLQADLKGLVKSFSAPKAIISTSPLALHKSITLNTLQGLLSSEAMA